MAASAIRIAQAYVQLDVRGQRRMENLLGKATKSVRVNARQMQRAGRAAFALGASALAGFTLAAKGASDLRESTNKTVEVFSSSAQSVVDWSQTTARSFGIAKADAQAYASELGLIIQQSGKTASESAKLSTEMSELAADLASFNNVDIDTAFEKLKSGLVGESKPLREFGILLNETEVAARAIELGFKKVNGELTEAAKVSARYSLIIEQSTKAQGDFARTSTDLANASRIAKAEFRDMSDAIGTAVLPAFNLLVKSAGALANFIKVLAENNPAVVKSFFNMSVFLVAVGSALLAAGTLTNTFATAMANLNKVTAVGTLLQTAFATAVGAGTAKIKLFQASLVAVVAYAAYQVGTVLADVFYGAGEAAKDLNDELVRTQILQKGLDEYNQSQLRKRFLSGDVTKKQEEAIRKEISKRKNQINDLTKVYDALRQARADRAGGQAPVAGSQAPRRTSMDDLKREKQIKEQIERLKKEIANREIVQKEIDAAIAAGTNGSGDSSQQEIVLSYLEQQEESLKRQRIELEKGKFALQEYIDLQEGQLTPAEAKSLRLKREKLDADEKANQVAQQRISDLKQINDSSKDQVKAIKDERDALKLGTIEVERQRNIKNGMSLQNANRIAQQQKLLEMEQKAIEVAERKKADAKALKESFQGQKRELELQIIALKKGEEVAQKLRDKEAGFTDDQVKKLAKLRKEQADLKALEDTKDVADEGSNQLKSIGGFFGGGFAQRLAVGTTSEEQARKQRIEQVKELRQIARAYRHFNASFDTFEKNQDKWFEFQKKAFGGIISR